MKLLADESVDRPIVERLRQDAHEVAYVAEMSPGTKDSEILDKANAAHELLVTGDKDFGELVFRQGKVHAGVVLLRLEGLASAAKAEAVAKAFREHGSELAGAFTVISPGLLRIRRAPES